MGVVADGAGVKKMKSKAKSPAVTKVAKTSGRQAGCRLDGLAFLIYRFVGPRNFGSLFERAAIESTTLAEMKSSALLQKAVAEQAELDFGKEVKKR